MASSDNTALKVLMGSFLLYRTQAFLSNLTWQDSISSPAYGYLSKVLTSFAHLTGDHWPLVEKIVGNDNVVAAYLSATTFRPLTEDGTRAPVPSTSPLPYKTIDPNEPIRVLEPFKLAGLTLKNRVIRAAAFDGSTVEQVVATHEGVAKGGVGMTVVAYCCVSKDGRTFEDQVDLSDQPKAMGVLRPVVEACHRHGTAICAQLTHAGSFSNRHINHTPNLAPSPAFNPGGIDFSKACDAKDMDRLVEDFVRGAIFAINDIGFDAIELHCGHGYMLSQWLSPLLNFRKDEYGGSPENRARFPLRILKAIRAAIGKDVPILVKLNAQDGVIGGLELPDALVLSEIFADHCDMIVVSCGLVAHNGFYMLRGTTPLDKLIVAMTGIKRWVTFAVGPLAVPAVPYEDCFLRDSARAILKRVGKKTKVCLLGGVSSLAQMEGAIDEGFAAVQMARPLIREPDFVLRIRKELLQERERKLTPSKSTEEGKDIVVNEEEFDVETKCIRCNQCVIASVDPTQQIGCPFRRLEDAAALRAASSQGATKQPTLSLSPTMARSIVKDIEDIKGPRL